MKELWEQVPRLLWEQTHKTPPETGTVDWSNALSTALLSRLPPESEESEERCAVYLSAEFLIGRLLHANLLNMGLLEEAEEWLAREGRSLNEAEELSDYGLGNGGLGRLAACFLDSAATLGIPLHGYGIRYRYGLFRQHFTDGFQRETPDDWMTAGDPWSRRREEDRVTVRFGGQTVYAVPYDMPVIGYGGKTVNRLRLWQAEATVPFDLAQYDKQQYDEAFRAQDEAACISAVLYPNDSTDRGRELRLKQQYFFCSASLQDLLRRFRRHKPDGDLSDWLVIQLNDTHPAAAIPELIRLLTDEGHMRFEDALDTARRVFAYTNHTVLPEAMEVWDETLFFRLLPCLKKTMTAIQAELERELTAHGVPKKEQAAFAVLDSGKVHMARLALFGSHAVNGVARLHSELLKKRLFPQWYALWPERFYNMTNGVTQRRWLRLANPDLSALITSRIGEGWITDLSELEKLIPLADDAGFQQEFLAAKQRCKERLSAYMDRREGVTIPKDWICDVQAKRLHEYKRQLLNAFSILDLYYALRDGKLNDFTPTVFLFGGKAAPGYARAKGIIKYIHELSELIRRDAAVSQKMQVRFVTNYDVSYAEKLFPAADFSVQISTAGTEASGTGNMKMMLNGALTIGTLDGANVEIFEEAGEENNYRFGATVEELHRQTDYDPAALYKAEPRIRRVVDSLIDGTFSDGGTGIFAELHDALLKGASWHKPDAYYVLGDFTDLVQTRLRANREYGDRSAFARKCILNLAHAGRFSSDRTVREYAENIWHLPLG